MPISSVFFLNTSNLLLFSLWLLIFQCLVKNFNRNLHDDHLPNLKFRCGNGYQASWQASVRISEGADNRGPDNRGSTVNVLIYPILLGGNNLCYHEQDLDSTRDGGKPNSTDRTRNIKG